MVKMGKHGGKNGQLKGLTSRRERDRRVGRPIFRHFRNLAGASGVQLLYGGPTEAR